MSSSTSPNKILWSTKGTKDLSETEELLLTQNEQLMFHRYIESEDDRSLINIIKCQNCILNPCKSCSLLRHPLNITLGNEFLISWSSISIVIIYSSHLGQKILIFKISNLRLKSWSKNSLKKEGMISLIMKLMKK